MPWALRHDVVRTLGKDEEAADPDLRINQVESEGTGNALGRAMNSFHNLPLCNTRFGRFRRKRSATGCPRGRPGCAAFKARHVSLLCELPVRLGRRGRLAIVARFTPHTGHGNVIGSVGRKFRNTGLCHAQRVCHRSTQGPTTYDGAAFAFAGSRHRWLLSLCSSKV
jgi:hypothetical protein